MDTSISYRALTAAMLLQVCFIRQTLVLETYVYKDIILPAYLQEFLWRGRKLFRTVVA